MEKQISEYQEFATTTKDKVNTFKTIAISFAEERSEFRKIRQENIRLLMELKESEKEVIVLSKKIHELSIISLKESK